jgi:hypothetical protein
MRAGGPPAGSPGPAELPLPRSSVLGPRALHWALSIELLCTPACSLYGHIVAGLVHPRLALSAHKRRRRGAIARFNVRLKGRNRSHRQGVRFDCALANHGEQVIPLEKLLRWRGGQMSPLEKLLRWRGG